MLRVEKLRCSMTVMARSKRAAAMSSRAQAIAAASDVGFAARSRSNALSIAASSPSQMAICARAGSRRSIISREVVGALRSLSIVLARLTMSARVASSMVPRDLMYVERSRNRCSLTESGGGRGTAGFCVALGASVGLPPGGTGIGVMVCADAAKLHAKLHAKLPTKRRADDAERCDVE